MSTETEERPHEIRLELQVDTGGKPFTSPEDVVVGEGYKIEFVQPDEVGHGFGLAEVIVIVVSVGTGVASDLIASAVKSTIPGVIRRVRTHNQDEDGTLEGLTRAIDSEKNHNESAS